MPPKKKPDVSKKTEQKKKEKIIEDKTFGLKNKKGAKQQKFIKTVHTQVTHGNPKTSKLATNQEVDKNKKKDEKKKLQEEINALFKPVAQTVAKGVDPKSVLCAFFKQGQCGKGDKCKFSHNLDIERKQEKRSIYVDKKDEMEDMDEEQLEELVNKKHGESNQAKPKTSLICKHFLEAVENSKYGWFWECPNGVKCIYRHALPPGFVLKKDQKKEDKEERISIEDLVETERAALGVDVTRVTLETFIKWKERKKREKIQNLKVENEKKKADYKAGRTVGISGRQMFEFNPDLIRNDDDEVQDGTIERERDEDDDIKVVDITMDSILSQAQEVDESGTQATVDRLKHMKGAGMVNGIDSESNKLDEAAALPPSASASSTTTASQQEEADLAIAAAVSATLNGDLEIDEDLFAEEDEDLIDELETLELEENNL